MSGVNDEFHLPEHFKTEKSQPCKFYKEIRIKGTLKNEAVTKKPSFYGQYNNFSEVLTKFMPPTSLRSDQRLEIYKNTGFTNNYQKDQVHALVAAIFPPVKVGNLAGWYYEYTTEGDIFPQFSCHIPAKFNKVSLKCEVCAGYVAFCDGTSIRHAILRNNSFDGLQNAKQHQHAPVHQEALKFMTANCTKKRSKRQKTTPSKPKTGLVQSSMTTFVESSHLN